MAFDYRLLNPKASDEGYDNMNAWADAAAKRQAGAMIATDPQAAMDHLNKNGLLGDATSVQQNVWAGQNREIAAQERAVTAAAAAEKKALDAEKREAEALGTMATNLQGVLTEHGAQAVLPAFDQLAKSWLAKGASPEHIAQMRQGLTENPEQFLTTIAGVAAQANDRFKLVNVAGSAGSFDGRTGTVDMQFTAPQYKTIGQGQSLVEVAGSGGPSDAPAAPAEGGAPAAPAKREGTPQERNARLQSEILSAIPGARMGSGVRTAERQAELVRELPGIAVPNSRHPSGDAQDFQVPGKGKDDLPEVTQMLRQAGVEFEDVLYHNNHFHVERGPNGASAPSSSGGSPVPASVQPASRVIASVAPRAATTAAWRTMTPAEVSAAGLREGGSYQVNATNGQTRVAQAPPAAARGANGARPAGAVRLTPQEAGEIKEIKKQGRELSNTADLYREWMRLNRQVETGGMMAMPGAGIARGAIDARVARMNAIQARLTPQMRQGMPGAASDRDVAMFGRSTVSIGAPRAANDATARAGQAFAQRQGDYTAYMEQYARDNGTLLGAQEGWDEYTGANPLFNEGTNGLIQVRPWTPWRTYFNRERAPAGSNTPRSAPSAPTGSPQRRRYNPNTGARE